MNTGWLSAEQASDVLGVRRQTLYTYASRGWIRTRPDRETPRRRCYLAADVLDLRRRAARHRGERPAAEAALDWGPAVLASAITSIDVDGPNYRGVPALELAERDAGFEEACALLWARGFDGGVTGGVREEGTPRVRLRRALVRAAEAGWERPEQVLLAMVGSLGRSGSDFRDDSGEGAYPHGIGGQGGSTAIAIHLARATTPTPSDEVVRAVQAALVVCADHELNASTFAARVAASVGASLPDALLAAFSTLCGSRHGGLSDAVEAWLSGADALPRHAAGHPLYPEGDPRADHLIERALRLASPPRRAHLVTRLRALSKVGPPNLDAGLASLAYAVHAIPGAPFAWFALGRTAGWMAHIQEQREQPGPLRPRARYTGP